MPIKNRNLHFFVFAFCFSFLLGAHAGENPQLQKKENKKRLLKEAFDEYIDMSEKVCRELFDMFFLFQQKGNTNEADRIGKVLDYLNHENKRRKIFRHLLDMTSPVESIKELATKDELERRRSEYTELARIIRNVSSHISYEKTMNEHSKDAKKSPMFSEKAKCFKSSKVDDLERQAFELARPNLMISKNANISEYQKAYRNCLNKKKFGIRSCRAFISKHYKNWHEMKKVMNLLLDLPCSTSHPEDVPQKVFED